MEGHLSGRDKTGDRELELEPEPELEPELEPEWAIAGGSVAEGFVCVRQTSISK